MLSYQGMAQTKGLKGLGGEAFVGVDVPLL